MTHYQDIVQQLERSAESGDSDRSTSALLLNAASAIAKLRARVAELEEKNEDLEMRLEAQTDY